MVESLRITEPSLLTDIAIKLSHLDLKDSLTSPPTTLVLLQPLANPATLAACLPHSPTTSASNPQYVNLRPLSLAWRQAVIKTPPMPDLVFDLRLPFPVTLSPSSPPEITIVNGVRCVQAQPYIAPVAFQKDEPPKIYWDIKVPREGGLVLSTKDVMMMIITIATGVRMRVDGEVRFRLVFSESEGISELAMTLLRKQLAALEKDYKNGGKGAAEGGERKSGEHN
jgi:hypothetical protein